MEENIKDKKETETAEKIKDSGKKAWEKSKEGIKHLSENIHQSLEDDSNEQTYGAFAYIPLIGPLVVYLFKKKQKFSKLHAKNALYLQSSALILWLTIWLLENIPFISHLLKAIQFIPYITNALLYINIVTFFILSLIGAYKGFNKNLWTIPVLTAFIEKYIVKKKNKDKAQSQRK
ncbi:MAG: DUF4870 domain-containing protein [Spirochaetia bacterium]|nr:DUF4870 domain-containing protein [Spirochaetia bacterium]